MRAKAYLSGWRLPHTDRPDVYVRRLLVNADRSWWRRRSSREVPVDRTADPVAAQDIGHDAGERDAMWRLIRRLPERQRAVIVLRYYEDLDDNTIAEILACSAVTVRTHAMRALATLREWTGLESGTRSLPRSRA